MTTRDQLTLFLESADAARIEPVRAVLDPVQASLIAAHVTLCREDELSPSLIAGMATQLSDVAGEALTLRFGGPQAFQGHGVLMPCIDGEADFHVLREVLLGREGLRRPAAHLTLAHPRNPKAPGNTPEAWTTLRDGLTATFMAIAHIRQEYGTAWRILRRWPLNGAKR